MTAQVGLFSIGVWQVFNGSPIWGIINIALNAYFFRMNYETLKNFKS